MKIVKFVTIVTLLMVALGCGQRPQPTAPGAEDDTSPEAVIPFNRPASEEMKKELVGKSFALPYGNYWKVTKDDLIHELTIHQVKALRGKDEVEAQATIDMTTPYRQFNDDWGRYRLKGPVVLTYLSSGQRWTLAAVNTNKATYTWEKK